MTGNAGGDYLDLNRAWWNERAPLHVAGTEYGVERWKAGGEKLRPFELDELGGHDGGVSGKTLVHPQCHFGLDTLSWARHGAHVTGLDFSEQAISAARSLATEAGIVAEFVCGEVYDAPELLGGRTFDIVYTGLGAINWLPDITRWASTMAALVAPGGTFYLAEFHPYAYQFAVGPLPELRVEYPYFRPTGEPVDWGELAEEVGSYGAPGAVTVHNRTIEWVHTLGQVVSAIIAAGLRIDFLHEHPQTLFRLFPWLTTDDAGDTYLMPPQMPSIPMMYSLRARAD